MFLKYNERVARIWFEITSMILDQTLATQSSIAALLHLLWNKKKFSRSNTWLFSLYIYFIDPVLGWCVKKVANVVFQFPKIWLVTLDKPWNRTGCSFLVARKKFRLRSENDATVGQITLKRANQTATTGGTTENWRRMKGGGVEGEDPKNITKCRGDQVNYGPLAPTVAMRFMGGDQPTWLTVTR